MFHMFLNTVQLKCQLESRLKTHLTSAAANLFISLNFNHAGINKFQTFITVSYRSPIFAISWINLNSSILL